MDTEKLGTLILIIIIVIIVIFVLYQGLKGYMTEEDKKSLYGKINKNLFLIVPLGIVLFIISIWLIYAVVIDKNAILIIEDLLENI